MRTTLRASLFVLVAFLLGCAEPKPEVLQAETHLAALRSAGLVPKALGDIEVAAASVVSRDEGAPLLAILEHAVIGKQRTEFLGHRWCARLLPRQSGKGLTVDLAVVGQRYFTEQYNC